MCERIKEGRKQESKQESKSRETADFGCEENIGERLGMSRIPTG